MNRFSPYINSVGDRLIKIQRLKNHPYPFEFHLLKDPKTINAFALPGGQMFTAALLSRMNSSSACSGSRLPQGWSCGGAT
jgi:predicted Zn-dependent protease